MNPRRLAFLAPLAVLLAGLLLAQTKTSPTQAALLYDPASFTLDQSTVPWTLRAVKPSGAAQANGTDVIHATGPTSVLTVSKPTFDPTSLMVFRNGLLLDPTFNYTVLGSTITFATSPDSAIIAGDTIQLRYRY